MAKLPNQCPSCTSPVTVTRLSCSKCGVQLDGEFNLPSLLSLNDDDMRFVHEFVLASGSLKEMARIRRQSYPTIRNRLNDIIAKLTPASANAETRRHEILDAVATGKLSVAEATRLLSEIGQ
jgi:hypothetical protein